jgi:hypothetical protein
LFGVIRLCPYVVLLFLLSCATGKTVSLGPLLEQHSLPVRVELTEVPYFPQEKYQCGPAALATVLVYSGVDTDPQALTPQVFLPGRKGSLPVELVASVRRHGRLPYPVAADLEPILWELHAGNPVLVLLNLGFDWRPVWHYAVVVGYDARDDSFIMRSGREKRQVMRAGRFLDAWRMQDPWGIVVVGPGKIPASAQQVPFLREAASLEKSGRLDTAEPGGLRALARERSCSTGSREHSVCQGATSGGCQAVSPAGEHSPRECRRTEQPGSCAG